METSYTPSDDNSIYASDAVWATAKAASTGTLRNSALVNVVQSSLDGGVYFIERTFIVFDTSALSSDAAISAATINLYGVGTLGSGIAVNVFASTCHDTVEAGDFDLTGDTKLCDTDIALASWNTSGFNAFALNASGLAAITKAGLTKICVRETLKDLANSAPGVSINQQTILPVGGANDPYISITYTLASPTSGGSFLLNFV